MKRQITWFIGIFIVWNLATYFLFTRPDNAKNQMLKSSKELSERLNRLQERLKDQMVINEELLHEIEQEKDKIIQKMSNKEDMDNRQEHQEQVIQDHENNEKLAEEIKPIHPFHTYTIPVVVIACNRPSAIKRSLNSLLDTRPSAEQFPVYVSQDCGDQKTADEIKTFGDKVVHMKQPDLSPIANLPANQKKFEGYYKISRHYKWALDQMFIRNSFDAVIIVEDDLDVSVDFFEYFLATYPLLKEDPTLWCVSAWNDNGRDSRIEKNPGLLYRTDFFPGLGWMLSRDVWLELGPKWPAGFWDDWMRHPDQRRGRSCIRPEISRTDTFGKTGVSKGQFFEQHLKFITLNKDFYPFTTKDLSYLLKKNYDSAFRERVYGVDEQTLQQIKMSQGRGPSEVRVTYTDKTSFKSITKAVGIMQDFKSGVPRTGYLGIVTCVFNGQRVYIAPVQHWSGYNPNWS
ncbi:alpha-1,3-mannosyl-glycoprotein 2-beta-N-acetylglucosaminyltransferase [Strongylocentrotus purpuratus]|uniref:Alpha-1,3-mannosyl-glycoprotein 2-beta-N-acetylglucosaminyltransferase n=1 Tax=Strongylocentrotus purpuratus TaxID=7668 RepID=A0A7M7SSL6_STRPU|nr:alpha-1,3-mannosyl-glycoprotein 2-beta-N-acetylglucosaminyltransferase [Strongylocentrotus purpuratus]